MNVYTAINDWLDGKLWGNITNQLATICLVTIAISAFCIVYNVKIRNRKEDEPLGGFLVLTDMIIGSCENLVVSSLGVKYRKLTPYVMYLILYIFVSALFSLIGFEPATTSYTVPLAMGLVTFLGIYYFGFRYQKLAYFKKYINPLELLTQFVPLISISFRLFGNMLGGSIILGLLCGFLIGMEASWGGGSSKAIWDMGNDVQSTDQFEYWWAGFNFMTAIALPWLHLYFDLFDGGVQAIVFTMLTLSYWAEAMGEEETKKTKKTKERKFKIKKRTNVSTEEQNINVNVAVVAA